MANVILQTEIPDVDVKHGKVRDIYDTGDSLIFVAIGIDSLGGINRGRQQVAWSMDSIGTASPDTAESTAINLNNTGAGYVTAVHPDGATDQTGINIDPVDVCYPESGQCNGTSCYQGTLAFNNLYIHENHGELGVNERTAQAL